MDAPQNDTGASFDDPDEVERWRGQRDAAWQALAAAVHPPGATRCAEIPPIDQTMMLALKMAHENEDFRKEVAKHIS